MPPRTRLTVCTGITLAAALAMTGCELTIDSRPSRTPTPSSTTTPPATSTPSTSPSIGGPDTIDRDLALNTAYVRRIKAKYPRYAANHSDAELATIGVRICVYLTEVGVDPLVYKRRIQHAYERDDVRPTEQDVKGISQVSIETICPELNDELDTIMEQQHG